MYSGKLFHLLKIRSPVGKGTQFHAQVLLSDAPNCVVSLTSLTPPLRGKKKSEHPMEEHRLVTG